MRADMGAENVSVARMQRFLRSGYEVAFSGDKYLLYGKSVSNQRIEAWWSFLKKSNASWWIDFFKDTRDEGIFCDHDTVQVECLRFCFMPMIQGELNKVATHWNLHMIRPLHNVESPSCRPDVLYYVPAWTNATDYRTEVDLDDIDVIDGVCCDRTSPTYCLEECGELIEILCKNNNCKYSLQLL